MLAIRTGRLCFLALLAPWTLVSCQTFEPLDWDAEYFKPAARVYFDTGKDDPDELDVFQDGALNAAVDFFAITYPVLVKKSAVDRSAQRALDSANARIRELEKQLFDFREKTGSVRSWGAMTKTDEQGGTSVALERQDAERAAVMRQQAMLGQKLEALRDQQLQLELKAIEETTTVAVQEAERAEKRARGSRLAGDWVVGPRLAVGFTGPAGDSENGDESSAPVVYASVGLFADFYRSGKTISDEDGVGVRLELGWVRGFSADEGLDDIDDSGVFVGLSVHI